jgi:thiol-disulfide isomerase/thioredoxin
MKATKISSLQRVLRYMATSISVLLMAISANAQQTRQLKINDTLPNIKINNLVRPEVQALTTKNLYQGKTLIINFWATWCLPCVQEMKTLAELTEKQPGKLQVLSVSYESKATVEKFLASQPEIANSKIRIISNDNTFSKMFFHQALPHNIWINGNGVVKAITGGEEISVVNVEKFIQNSDNKMRLKKETPFDMNKTASIPDSIFTYRSILSRELPGVYMSGSSVSGGKLGRPYIKRFYTFNLLVKDIFWLAHQMPGGAPNMYLMEIHTKDSTRFFWPGEGKSPAKYNGITKGEWDRANWYTYEFRSPKILPDSIIFPHVISDLQLYFDMKSYKELKKKMCRVVTYDHKNGKIKKAGPDEKYNLGPIGNNLVISNVPMDYLLDMILMFTFKTVKREPYLNKTNLKGNISATVDLGPDPQKYGDVEHWEKCMTEQLGLKFELKEALYPVLILKDNSF